MGDGQNGRASAGAVQTLGCNRMLCIGCPRIPVTQKFAPFFALVLPPKKCSPLSMPSDAFGMWSTSPEQGSLPPTCQGRGREQDAKCPNIDEPPRCRERASGAFARERHETQNTREGKLYKEPEPKPTFAHDGASKPQSRRRLDEGGLRSAPCVPIRIMPGHDGPRRARPHPTGCTFCEADSRHPKSRFHHTLLLLGPWPNGRPKNALACRLAPKGDDIPWHEAGPESYGRRPHPILATVFRSNKHLESWRAWDDSRAPCTDARAQRTTSNRQGHTELQHPLWRARDATTRAGAHGGNSANGNDGTRHPWPPLPLPFRQSWSRPG